MEQNKLVLAAEQGTSLSSGSLRLYALPYGCVDLYNYDPINRRAAVGIMVASEHRGRGYALAMLRSLEEMYKNSLHQLYADIITSNIVSLHLFQKAGYTECGRFREWVMVDQEYVDTVRMQLILKS